MVDVTKTGQVTQQAIAGWYSVVTATVDTNDTITFGDYTSVSTALALRQDTGVQLSTTITTNIVTITTAGLSKVPVVLLVWGKR